jgi:hypothetical protein
MTPLQQLIISHAERHEKRAFVAGALRLLNAVSTLVRPVADSTAAAWQVHGYQSARPTFAKPPQVPTPPPTPVTPAAPPPATPPSPAPSPLRQAALWGGLATVPLAGAAYLTYRDRKKTEETDAPAQP